ncbi:uncharacterized protein LOC126669032 [Mercurialis annua]|uniref:uncharacterized protein LOC126669032 n=1 Tax=Mercurialis annua TaxID=3986 RepID=UPI00215F2401|nr:uncharacterized protein LOC126669032 [Mercurialis annua]
MKQLWDEGIATYDAHSEENFNLRASILWTISDFLNYAYLSGWSTKGHMTCPCCLKETASCYRKGARKICYMGHCRFLPRTHKWRQRSELFDRTKEKRNGPNPLSGEEVLGEISLFVLGFIDVMHIEKDICDNILGTLMEHKDKNKDNENSRYDLLKMGIRPKLHLRIDGATSPDEYLSNILRCVNKKEWKITSMKSHDCQTIDLESIGKLQVQIINILCKLEMIFPPVFFDVMVHLAVHLPMEAKLGCLVLAHFKIVCSQMARPEGSITADYLVNECLTFCSRYLVGVDIKHNRMPRNYDSDNSPSEKVGLEIFKEVGRGFGKSNHHRLTLSETAQCHSYVLYNCDEVLSFIVQRKSELAASPSTIIRTYNGYINNGFRFHTRDCEVIRKSQNSGVMVRGDDVSSN